VNAGEDAGGRNPHELLAGMYTGATSMEVPQKSKNKTTLSHCFSTLGLQRNASQRIVIQQIPAHTCLFHSQALETA
jgi:hypothetical protein